MDSIHKVQYVQFTIGLIYLIAAGHKSRLQPYLFVSAISLLVVTSCTLLDTQPPRISLENVALVLHSNVPFISQRIILAALGVIALVTLRGVAYSYRVNLDRLEKGKTRRERELLNWSTLIGYLLTMLLVLFLISCSPKRTPATPTAPPIPTVDSTRIKLQNQADTSRSRADRSADAANSTVTDYETDAKTYDSLRNPL